MKKIDFRKILVTQIDGSVKDLDMTQHATGELSALQEFANYIYNKTQDIGELEFARKLYKSDEIELTDMEVATLQKYASEYFKAFVTEAISNLLK
uniref:Phage protein n=1 Tax=Prevotella sp. GTC17260 TaxID=3236796 RepID=A0AB33JHG0_9BACT